MMFRNSPMKILTLHRNHQLTMQINWLVSTRYESPPKSIIERPRIQKQNSLQSTQVRFESIHFTLTRLLPLKKRAEVTISLQYLTRKELQFLKYFSSALLFSWDLIHLFYQSV